MIVVIPWAGQNRRFQDEGIFTPKLMLRMPDGRRLLSWILDSIPSPKRIVLVGRREHETEWGRKLAHFRLPPDVSLHCLWLVRRRTSCAPLLSHQRQPDDPLLGLSNQYRRRPDYNG